MSEVFFIYLLALFNYSAARALHAPLMTVLRGYRLVRENYAGEKIPFFGGLTLALGSLGGLYLAANLLSAGLEAAVMLVAVIFIAGLGLVDDLWGGNESKGFKGHFLSFFTEKKVTTGFIKAAGGGTFALAAAALFSLAFRDIVVNTLLIALMTNLLNLFDLRPGRALKVFFFVAAVVLLVPGDLLPRGLLWLMIGPGLVFLPWDLNGRVMLGDTGANVLGVSLGLVMVWILPVILKVVIVGLLVYLHWYSERKSFNQVIENSRFIRHLDLLGRE